jgi:hypothetical protein
MSNNVCEQEVISVGPTPIVLAYFAEHDKGTREELTRIVLSVSRKMEGTGARIDATFRGELNNPEGEIWSETVDDELWYWLSNNFLAECKSDNNTYLERIKSLEEYKLCNMEDNLKEVPWPSNEVKKAFIKVLQGEIDNDSIRK